MVKRITTIVQSNRQVLKNMTWLTVIQFANYLIPLLIIPYIVRVLGTETFGKVSYAQNIISYFTLIVNFGFEYSATQEVALNRNNKTKLNTIFWSVIRFKILLLIITAIVLGFLFFSFDKIEQNRQLYFYAWLINVGFVLYPNWFLQGIEKMGVITFFQFINKIIGFLLIFIVVRNSESFRYYPLVLSLTFIVVAILALLYVIKKYHLSYNTDNDNKAIKKGIPVFLNSIFASLYTISGLTVLGFYVNDYKLGIYSGAYKIITAVLMIVSAPITMALFPVISRKFHSSLQEGFKFYKKIFLIISLYGLVISLMIFFSSEIIVNLILGKGFIDSIVVLKILSFLPFLVIVASMLTIQGMYGLQLYRYAPFIGLVIGILGLFLNFILIKRFNIIGAAWSYIIAEILEIIIVFILLLVKFKKSYAYKS